MEEPVPIALEWDETAPMDPHVEQLMFDSRDDDEVEDVLEEEIEPEAEQKVAEWWLNPIGAMTIPIMQEAFIKCQPRDSSKYLYTCDLAKEDADVEEARKRVQKTHGGCLMPFTHCTMSGSARKKCLVKAIGTRKSLSNVSVDSKEVTPSQMTPK